MSEGLKYRFIRTPLERPLLQLRELLEWPKQRLHPELGPIYAENGLIRKVLERAVQPQTRCLDIGAHYGSMLSAMLRRAPHGRHAAVEAIPAKVEFLRRKFPEVQIHACALGSSSGTIEFFVNVTRSGFSSMARHGTEDDEFRRIEVPCRTLDELTEGQERFDFVKVDVEGAEEQVFRGGRDFLARDRPVVLFECGPSGAEAFGAEPVGVFDALDEVDYEVFFLHAWLGGGESASRERFQEALVYPFQAFNWVAQPRGSG